MALKIESKMPFGNARVLSVRDKCEIPEISFAADPHFEKESLWFYFRIAETDPSPVPAQKLKITWQFFDYSSFGQDPLNCRPVFRHQGQEWNRVRPGKINTEPDGQRNLSWEVDYPAPSTEFALCFPYGDSELNILQKKSKGYWKYDSIGLTTRGKQLKRISNNYGTTDGKKTNGIYFVARQKAGETPGSWVLDGFLKELARVKHFQCLVWGVPIVNLDGALRGNHGPIDSALLPNNDAKHWPTSSHESRVIATDINRWSERCTPALLIDFQASAPADVDGIYANIQRNAENPEAQKGTMLWAEAIRSAFGSEFSAENFIRSSPEQLTSDTGLASWVIAKHEIAAITLKIPYTSIKESLLSRNSYREAGKKIASLFSKKLPGSA